MSLRIIYSWNNRFLRLKMTSSGTYSNIPPFYWNGSWGPRKRYTYPRLPSGIQSINIVMCPILYLMFWGLLKSIEIQSLPSWEVTTNTSFPTIYNLNFLWLGHTCSILAVTLAFHFPALPRIIFWEFTKGSWGQAGVYVCVYVCVFIWACWKAAVHWLSLITFQYQRERVYRVSITCGFSIPLLPLFNLATSL